HEAVLCGSDEALAREAPGSDALVVDLTAEVDGRLAAAAALGADRPPTIAFYSHVEAEVRARAQDAGLELVVPRSRMARQGAPLGVGDRLLVPADQRTHERADDGPPVVDGLARRGHHELRVRRRAEVVDAELADPRAPAAQRDALDIPERRRRVDAAGEQRRH